MNLQQRAIKDMAAALAHAEELLPNDTVVMNGAAVGRWLLEQPTGDTLTPDEAQPAAWVGLTDYEIGVCSTEAAMNKSEMVGGAITFARAIEAKLREKRAALDQMAQNTRELGLSYDTKGGA